MEARKQNFKLAIARAIGIKRQSRRAGWRAAAFYVFHVLYVVCLPPASPLQEHPRIHVRQSCTYGTEEMRGNFCGNRRRVETLKRLFSCPKCDRQKFAKFLNETTLKTTMMKRCRFKVSKKRVKMFLFHFEILCGRPNK